MSTPVAEMSEGIEKAGLLPSDARDALRDLILVLADNKRLLGIRYSDWMLGAPTLESGIAASSMAQDEWGHGRLAYSLLSDFGDNPKQIEHERDAPEYRGMDVLDRPFRSWSELVAANLIVDTALSVQYGALAGSRYVPVHNRVQKLLDEESFHFQHAAGWARQLAQAGAVRQEFQEALGRLLPAALRWFGTENSPSGQRLVEEALVRASPDELRRGLLARVGPVLEAAGLAEPLGVVRENGGWRYTGELRWDDWNEATRRSGAGGPDADTIARVRGDKNRAMLLD